LPAPQRGNRKRRRLALAALATLAFVAGCQHRLPAPHPSSVPPSVPPPPSKAPQPGHWTETGLASWYGVPFNGHRAADGQIFNMYQMVAAHRTLPFGSLVRVTDLQNGRQVVVRIIDRGPFVKNRIIDLSFGAARVLGMIGPGVAPVRLRLLSKGKAGPVGPEFTVQVGAFAVLRNAERLRRRLGKRWGPVFIQKVDSAEGLLYRVRVGDVSSEAAARRLARQLEKHQGFRTTFVVRLDR
jgi:rare lipoprotein A